MIAVQGARSLLWGPSVMRMWRQSAYLGPWVGPLAGPHHLLKTRRRQGILTTVTGPVHFSCPPRCFFLIYLRHLYGAWFRWAFAHTYNTHCDNKSKRFWFILFSFGGGWAVSFAAGRGYLMHRIFGRVRCRDLFVRRRRNCPAKYLYSTTEMFRAFGSWITSLDILKKIELTWTVQLNWISLNLFIF